MKPDLIFACSWCSVIICVSGFSAGVPPLPKVCKSLTPQHGNYTPQRSEAPFEISVEPSTAAGGDTLIVTLKSTGDSKFKGFYVQARGENGLPIGTFQSNKLTEVHSCGGVRWNGAYHASGKVEKDLVMIKWEAPRTYEGEVNFLISLGKAYDFQRAKSFINTSRKAPVPDSCSLVRFQETNSSGDSTTQPMLASFVKNYVTIWTGVYTDPVIITARNQSEGTRGGSGTRGGIVRRPPLQFKPSALLQSVTGFFGRILRPTSFLRLFSNTTRS